MTDRIGCAVLGATGMVGQRFIERLADHPWFEVGAVVASDANVGRPYGDVVDWCLDCPVPTSVAGLPLQSIEAIHGDADLPLIFSALPSGAAGPAESRLASAGHMVCTNASAHRMDPDVPLLIPEVNAAASTILPSTGGGIVANGNCSGIILTLALAPLAQAFGIDSVDVTTMQARSGAGHPDRVDLDTDGNVLPFIAGEEEKLQMEPQKTLGVDFPVRATCTRVHVRDGHLESVHVRLRRPATETAVREAFTSFRGPPEVRSLPSAPERPIHVLDGDDAPQPRRDVDVGGGMAVTVGRIRVDGPHVRFLVLGHNTVRGAAGQSVLNAEYLHAQGRLVPANTATA